VRSLAIVPVRAAEPVGSIGAYWADLRSPTDAEAQLLQALATSTATALENVDLFRHLERRVAERTEELEAARRELESFSYSVAHDLRGSLRAVAGFGRILRDDHAAALDDDGRDCVARILAANRAMTELTDGLFELSMVNRVPLIRRSVPLTLLADQIMSALRDGEPARSITWRVAPGLTADGDPGLLRVLLQNLLGNAWKFTSKRADTVIELGAVDDPGGERIFFVRDNGVGFDMAHAGRLFAPFQRLHGASEFVGTGIGLATCRRVVRRHDGRIWAEAAVGQGATVSFTLEAPPGA
jgi:light-regulated signal transduction histidine kinase (bacteriophytochrome)